MISFIKTVIEARFHVNRRPILALLVSPVRPVRFLATLILFLAALILSVSVSPGWATSPVGMNLSGVAYWSSEQPFLNIFKTAFTYGGTAAGPTVGWLTQSTNSGAWDTGEEQYLKVDSNGWPTSLTASGEASQQFNAVGALMLFGLTDAYPSGTYVAIYQGAGTVTFGFDASAISSSTTSPCSNFPSGATRVLLNAAWTSSGSGIYLQITATDPNKVGNYIRNIQVVYAPTSTASVCDPNEQALMNGSIFTPTFLSKIASFSPLRFMDWMQTNNSPNYTWAQRPLPTWAFWSGPYGVPMEVMVDLVNQTGASAWFSMPTSANSTFVTNFATYVYQNLGANQNVYLEYTNEFWNGSTGVTSIVQALGAAKWPSQPNDFNLAANYYGMQTALNCQAWKTAWGSASSRVVCVMGNQTGNWGVGQTALNCSYWASGPCSTNYGISAVADTAYFSPGWTSAGVPPKSWLKLSDGGLANLCAAYTTGGVDPGAPNGYIAITLANIASDYQFFSSTYGLGLVGYEGGPGLETTNSAYDNLYVNFTESSCMQSVYASFLQQLTAQGYMQFFNQYNDAQNYCASCVGAGLWGALDNIWETGAPVYDALISFIASTQASDPPPSGGGTTTTPPVPTGLAGTLASATQVNLSWTESTGSVAAAGYKVFQNGTQVGSTSTTSYQATGLSAGTTYTYSVSAYAASGSASAQSSSISITTPAPPTVAITSPANGTVITTNTTLSITATASDSSGIASITIRKNNTTTLKTCTKATSCSTSTSITAAGSHVISATAVSATWGLSSTASVTVVKSSNKTASQ